MKIYRINKHKVSDGLMIDHSPFHKIVLGKGKDKRSTWMPIGTKDVPQITEEVDICRQRGKFVTEVGEGVSKNCRLCGEILNTDGNHPDAGMTRRINKANVLFLRDKETGKRTGKYLLVAPRENIDDDSDRVLVLWRVPFSSAVTISSTTNAKIVAMDVNTTHSLETAECFAILNKGQSLTAEVHGQQYGTLTYSGKQLDVKEPLFKTEFIKTNDIVIPEEAVEEAA